MSMTLPLLVGYFVTAAVVILVSVIVLDRYWGTSLLRGLVKPKQPLFYEGRPWWTRRVLIGEDLDERMEQHLPNLLDNDTVAQAIGPYADILLLIDKTPWLSPSEILLVVRVIIGILLVSLGIAVWYLWLGIDKKRKEREY